MPTAADGTAQPARARTVTDVVDLFLLSLAAMFNPSLPAAVTVMLLLTEPKRLMVGYLLAHI